MTIQQMVQSLVFAERIAKGRCLLVTARHIRKVIDALESAGSGEEESRELRELISHLCDDHPHPCGFHARLPPYRHAEQADRLMATLQSHLAAAEGEPATRTGERVVEVSRDPGKYHVVQRGVAGRNIHNGAGEVLFPEVEVGKLRRYAIRPIPEPEKVRRVRPVAYRGVLGRHCRSHVCPECEKNVWRSRDPECCAHCGALLDWDNPIDLSKLLALAEEGGDG